MMQASGNLLATALVAVSLLGCGGDDSAPGSATTTTGGGGSGGEGGGGGGASNLAPLAVDDSATTPANQPVMIYVLQNDKDPDGDMMFVKEVVQPANGVVTLATTSVTYTPDATFSGNETFSYTVSDVDGASDEANVTVTVKPLPTLIITSPMEGETVTGPDVPITFEVTGCSMASPTNDPEGCHVHKFLDMAAYKDADGMGFGHYTPVGFTISPVMPGNHEFTLMLILNDGSDAPWEPQIEDTVSFVVQ
jgi:hypothetical protein